MEILQSQTAELRHQLLRALSLGAQLELTL